jgi:hypothetical protein
MTPGSKSDILELASELRLRIYDYIFNDAGDQRLEVTLDHNDKLHFHNGPALLSSIRRSKRFPKEVTDQLFKHTTFILRDDQRTCRPIIAAFVRTLKSQDYVRVRKVIILFFTIRGFFDSSHFERALSLYVYQFHNEGTYSAQFLPYVLARLVAQDRPALVQTQIKLCRDLDLAFQLLDRITNLTSLELGVGVLEFLIYGAASCNAAWSFTPNLTSILDGIRSGKVKSNHLLLDVLCRMSGLNNLHSIQPDLMWRDFVEDGYDRAGVGFGQGWTVDVRDEMRGRYKRMVTARITGVGVRWQQVYLLF